MVDPTTRGRRAIDRFREQMPLAKPVDDLIGRTLLGADPALTATLAANRQARLVPHDVAPNQGKLLELLVRGSGATRVLEIGTLGGYSTIWLARGAGPAGRVITIEQDPRHAAVALDNLRRAGVADLVDVRVGAALSVLPDVLRGSDQKFDFVFIDADKENDVSYMQWAIRLSRPGAMILVDNVVRFGGVLDPDAAPEDPGARGSRDLLEFLSTAPGIDCTAIQTVGEKGWDGFVLAVVVGD
ncbi:MAG TPA: O-methyltransferase [Streptosporangiaceae bacterium]|nr:O-methyltransferase [Streptosporangiaceae bacterium]